MNEPTWKKVSLRLEDVSNEVLNDDAFKVISSANPNKINKGKIVNKGQITEIEIEGKPSIIMTIAEANPKEETLRRFPVLYLDEGTDQTKAILKRQAEFAKKGKSADYDEKLKESLKYLKRVKVKIPFADKLTSFFCPENVGVRTHFPRFLDYIKSACAFHQYQREQDEEGYYIAVKEDYDLARLVLAKTTSNILMIPLTKLRKDILSIFEKKDLQRKSIEDLENEAGIKKINITPEWLRKQLDWLSSKGFLDKDSERRQDESGKTIPKPVFVYSFNKLQQLIIPEFEKLDEISSIASNKKITSNSSISSNSRVNEAIEVFELKKDITQNKGFFLYCDKCGKSLNNSEAEFKQGLAYCKDCLGGKVK